MKLRIGACALVVALAGCSGGNPESGVAGMRGVAATQPSGTLPAAPLTEGSIEAAGPVGHVPQAMVSTRRAKSLFTRPITPFCSWIARGLRKAQAALSAGIVG